MRDLRSYAAQQQILSVPSDFSLNTHNNSHGEILRRFVLDHPIHPCCVLVPNSALFRHIVDGIGFSGVRYLLVEPLPRG
jgi:hypothetical protein